MRASRLCLGLGIAAVMLVVTAMCVGDTSTYGLDVVGRALLAVVGLSEPVHGAHVQTILELRLWRALTACGVGGCLAVAGTLLQGLFRNGLAAPSLLGVTSGASIGATLAILIIGGYGPTLMLTGGHIWLPYLVTVCAFVGALAIGFLVLGIATRGGSVSVPTLLLVGIAVNSCLSGGLTAVQSLVLDDYQVSRALLAWTFGTLDDRSGYHVVIVFGGLVVAASAIAFVATELDLVGGGEDDAQALGVDLAKTKALVLIVAAVVTACAVSSAGQIAFIGLVVPHLLRPLVGSHHRPLLWASLFGGAVFLLATDVAQVVTLGRRVLPPGVVNSVLGGPMLFYLVLREKRTNLSW